MARGRLVSGRVVVAQLKARRQARWLVMWRCAHLRPDDRKLLQRFYIGTFIHRRHWNVPE